MRTYDQLDVGSFGAWGCPRDHVGQLDVGIATQMMNCEESSMKTQVYFLLSQLEYTMYVVNETLGLAPCQC